MTLKGRYGRGGYKLFYFNYEPTMFIIACIMIFYVALAQRAFESLVRLFLAGNLSYTACLVFLCLVHSNFYRYEQEQTKNNCLQITITNYINFISFWVHVNYFNDNFHNLHLHQTYFSITELIVTLAVFTYMDKPSSTNTNSNNSSASGAYSIAPLDDPHFNENTSTSNSRNEMAMDNSNVSSSSGNLPLELPAWIIFTISFTHFLQSQMDQGLLYVLLELFLLLSFAIVHSKLCLFCFCLLQVTCCCGLCHVVMKP